MCDFANNFIPQRDARTSHQITHFVLRMSAFTRYPAVIDNYLPKGSAIKACAPP